MNYAVKEYIKENSRIFDALYAELLYCKSHLYSLNKRKNVEIRYLSESIEINSSEQELNKSRQGEIEI